MWYCTLEKGSEDDEHSTCLHKSKTQTSETNTSEWRQAFLIRAVERVQRSACSNGKLPLAYRACIPPRHSRQNEDLSRLLYDASHCMYRMIHSIRSTLLWYSQAQHEQVEFDCKSFDACHKHMHMRPNTDRA